LKKIKEKCNVLQKVKTNSLVEKFSLVAKSFYGRTKMVCKEEVKEKGWMLLNYALYII